MLKARDNVFTYFKKELGFFFTLILWTLAGRYGGFFAAIPIILITLLLYKRANNYYYLFIGFWFILILGDSREQYFDFAKSSKTIYFLFLFFIYLFNSKNFNVISNPVFKYFMPFLIFSLILVFRSDVTLICFQKTLSYALLFLIVPAYLIKLISEKGEEVIKWINYFGLFILLVGLAFYLLGQDIAFLGGRYRGILGNPNGLGIFSTLLLLFFEISRNKFPKLFSKKEMWLIYTVLLLSLVLSQARTSLFTVLIFLFFNYLYKYSAFLGFLIFLMSIFIYQIVLNNIIEIILFLNLEEYFRIETIDEGSGRYVAWDFAWENIQKNFFIGKGFVFADDLFHKNYVPLSKMGHQGGVHNSYLNFWLDTGLVGLILYFVGFFMLFIKAAKRNKAALPIMYAVLFSITFESWLNSSLNSFTIIFVMIVTLLFQDNESVSKESHLPIH